MSNFQNEYSSFLEDRQRVTSFKTSSRENGRRTLPFFNTNLKTLGTLCSYIQTMYSIDTYPQDTDGKKEVHQKNSIINELNFRSIDNKDDQNAITRSNIINKAIAYFDRGTEHGFVQFLVYILLLSSNLNESTNIRSCAEEFFEKLPKYFFRKIYKYTDDILSDGAFHYNNVFQALIVLYGDKGLFNSFIKDIEDYYPDEDRITKDFNDESLKQGSIIESRLATFQKSSFKKEAAYLCLYYSLQEFILRKRLDSYITGNKKRNANSFFIEFLEYLEKTYPSSYKLFGNVSDESNFNLLKNFITNNLDDVEREELYKSIALCFNLIEPPDTNEVSE